jgi:hypothetical protein
MNLAACHSEEPQAFLSETKEESLYLTGIVLPMRGCFAEFTLRVE